jgi:ribosomal protein S18 acetylase RimI-like enzyme
METENRSVEVIIRRVESQDLVGMTAARIDYLTELQGERPEYYKLDLQEKLQLFFQQAMQEGSFFAFLAEVDGLACSWGAMILKKIPGDFNQSSYLEGDILNMYTLPSFRRKGISSRILKRLLSEAKTMGISKVALHCSKDGEPLYRKYGFTDPVYPYLELQLFAPTDLQSVGQSLPADCKSAGA